MGKVAMGIAGLLLAAISVNAQDEGDGVIRTCLAQNNSADICICASFVLHARLGDEPYTRFGVISDRIAAIENGSEAEDGEMAAMTNEGYQYFVPHGQAIAACRAKIAAGG